MIQENNWAITIKKGKGKLPLFCGNIERVIPIYAWRDITLWFLPEKKFRMHVLHLLAHGVPPQCITILTVSLNCLLHIIWNLYPELLSLQLIFGNHSCNYVILLLQSMRYSPS